jgi:predicted phage terminase large subunit-like protein
MSKITDKQSIINWEDFRHQIRNATSVNVNETPAEKIARMKKMEADPEAWFVYYFPKYSFAKPAKFHIKSTKTVLANSKLYQCRAWARGLSKSTRRMFEVFYLMLVKKFPVNSLLISKSYDNAERLLEPYMVNLDSNLRIINDYGIQEKPGSWGSGEFTTRNGAAFRAVGADQNPRGNRNEEVRTTMAIFDDIDDDEVCRNQERLKLRWEWIEKAVIPTVDIARDYYIFFDNNIIAPNSLALMAQQYADDVSQVAIRDENGISTWPEKNSEENIDYLLSKISYAAGQGEYFNNPIIEGSVFKNLAYKAVEPLQLYKAIVCYTDPSYKEGKKNDFKATALVGYSSKGEYHVIKFFCQQTTTDNMVDFYYTVDAYNTKQVPIYYFFEDNLNREEILRKITEIGYSKYGKILGVSYDDRQKGDKFTRIESMLEPLDRNGNLFFNADEKDNPDMKIAIGQFAAFAPKMRSHDDAPDAVEGAIFKLRSKIESFASKNITVIKRKPSKGRY